LLPFRKLELSAAKMSHAPCRNAASFKPLLPSRLRAKPLAGISSSPRRNVSASAASSQSRRDFLLLIPSLAAASAILRPLPSSAADGEAPPTDSSSPSPPSAEEAGAVVEEVDESALSRVYDATVIGEPEAVGKDARGRVWEKLTAARVVYLGEAELVPDPDDRVLELEIMKGLATRCAEAERGVAVALEAFPCDLQQQLDQFMDGRFSLSSVLFHFSYPNTCLGEQNFPVYFL
jgi:hypothetical protein